MSSVAVTTTEVSSRSICWGIVLLLGSGLTVHVKEIENSATYL